MNRTTQKETDPVAAVHVEFKRNAAYELPTISSHLWSRPFPPELSGGRPSYEELGRVRSRPGGVKAGRCPRTLMAKIPAIEQTFYYAVPPDRVYSALTDPGQLARWFVEKAEVVPKKGGAFRLTWAGGYSMRGKVKNVDPAKKLQLAWVDRFEGGKVFETEARFVLQKKGRGTLLTLTHRGFKSGKKWTALYGGIQSGWAYYLTNLRSVLEHGIDLRSDRDALG